MAGIVVLILAAMGIAVIVAAIGFIAAGICGLFG